MTDKEYLEQKKRIEKLIKKWVGPLGLNWWELAYIWVRGEHDGNNNTDYAPFVDGKTNRWTCIMEVTTDYYYKTATIKFYLETCMGYDDDAIERYFVHELMHIFLKPMHSTKTAHEEELVATHLANAFIWSRIEGERVKK